MNEASPSNRRAPRQPLYLQISRFLPAAMCSDLYAHVRTNEARFVGSSVETSAVAYRRSRVLHEFEPYQSAFLEFLGARLPAVAGQLGFGQPGRIESQITAHNDGHYYKQHNDNGSPATRGRIITFVYYFSSDPPAFSGGELKLHDSRVENGFYVADERFELITPRNNSIVFFASHHMHEVMPVRCPSQQFKDGRFTVNGWVWAGP